MEDGQEKQSLTRMMLKLGCQKEGDTLFTITGKDKDKDPHRG